MTDHAEDVPVGRCCVCDQVAELPNLEKALLVECLRRYEAALRYLRAVLEQRERAKGLARLSFDRAWQEGATGFEDLGNWLDEEIDRRVPPPRHSITIRSGTPATTADCAADGVREQAPEV